MKKKIISKILVTALAVTMVLGATMCDTTPLDDSTDPKSSTIALSIAVTPSYSVTLPASISWNKNADGHMIGKGSLKVEGVLGDDNIVTVSLDEFTLTSGDHEAAVDKVISMDTNAGLGECVAYKQSVSGKLTDSQISPTPIDGEAISGDFSDKFRGPKCYAGLGQFTYITLKALPTKTATYEGSVKVKYQMTGKTAWEAGL